MVCSLHPELNQILFECRLRRGFDPDKYLDAKILLLNSHFRQAGITSVVVGVSGGIDSAVVLGLIAKAAQQPDSPIKRIVGALLPYFTAEGTSNQDIASARGKEVVEAFGAECVLVDLSSSHAAMKASVEAAFAATGDAWAGGQLVSYLRTPAFYYLTALLTQEGCPAVFLGTTNRDEGGYIGYFGKAADAMVDIQVISDIHKSEVFALAERLDVPASVIEAAPTGDIYDGRTDEQLIGAPYDFIELYSYYLCLENDRQREALTKNLSSAAISQFNRWSQRLQQLNKQSTHKYHGGSPAANFDIYERAVPGGWRLEPAEPVPFGKRFDSIFVNQIELSRSFIEQIDKPQKKRVFKESLPDFDESAFLLHGVFSRAECEALLSELSEQAWIPVGIHGMLKDFDPTAQAIGSWRASYFSERLAGILWDRIAPAFPVLRIMEDTTPTDWEDERVWRAFGTAPLMRFIRYTDSGMLVPHYDSAYIQDENRRSLMSVVLYLTDAGDNTTRFIKDSQAALPLAQKDYSDWTRAALSEEILLSVAPPAGSALIFDHRILHDAAPLSPGTQKIIMRTDIAFRRCGLPVQTKVFVGRPLGMPEHV